MTIDKKSVEVGYLPCGSRAASTAEVSLPREPWDDDGIGIDPRRESAPRTRTYMVGSPLSLVERNIGTIRAALQDYRSEVRNG